MRYWLLLVAAAAGMALMGQSAEARDYPWCAIYDFGGDSATNCGFDSFEQCLATVRGIGGFCERNTLYQAPPRSRYAPRRLHRPRPY